VEEEAAVGAPILPPVKAELVLVGLLEGIVVVDIQPLK
jgi:hypothetical protein